jgi:hypothetical protein
VGGFIRRLIRHFEGIFLRISLRGSRVSALFLFVDDVDPSNVGNRLRFAVFR